MIEQIHRPRRRVHAGVLPPAPSPPCPTASPVPVGPLAVAVLERAALGQATLDSLTRSLHAHAGLALLHDDAGSVAVSERGFPPLLVQLRRLLESSSTELRGNGGRQAVSLMGDGHSFAVLAAQIGEPPGTAGSLCVGRGGGGFRPEEKELLLHYARAMALALARLRLGPLTGSPTAAEVVFPLVFSFVAALEAKDVHLRGHSRRVSCYAAELARAMGRSPAEVALARRAGLLHDIGKLVLPDAVLREPGRLGPEQRLAIRQHPLVAGRILAPFRVLARETEAVRAHHERYDGEGYPDGRRGSEIPLAGRIVAVADALDAMTVARPCEPARSLAGALAEIRREARRQFDPEVAEACAVIPPARLAAIGRSRARAPSAIPEALAHTA